MKVREIKSAKNRENWGSKVEHLIKGTLGKKAGVTVEGFGDMFVDKIRAVHVETWKEGIATLIAAGDYAPTTANGWLAILKVIMKAAKRRHQLPLLATEGIESFDESEHETYTDEEPNSLTPAELPGFIALLRELHPAHFAMI